jgi:hypothetical protein
MSYGEDSWACKQWLALQVYGSHTSIDLHEYLSMQHKTQAAEQNTICGKYSRVLNKFPTFLSKRGSQYDEICPFVCRGVSCLAGLSIGLSMTFKPSNEFSSNLPWSNTSKHSEICFLFSLGFQGNAQFFSESSESRGSVRLPAYSLCSNGKTVCMYELRDVTSNVSLQYKFYSLLLNICRRYSNISHGQSPSHCITETADQPRSNKKMVKEIKDKV